MPSIELKESMGCTRKFRVEVEQERLDEQMKSTVKNVKRDVQIPGFRKGKVPESLLLQRFGPTIRQEAVRDLIPVVLRELFEAEGIKPVNEPDIFDLEVNDSGPISFTVAVEELPEVDISGFEGLEVTREIREVTDADVDMEIERIRNMYATQEEVDRGAGEGDILVVNLQRLDSSGVPIIGEKMENHVIALDGSSTPSPEFDEQVMGMAKGDRKTVRFTYDESINRAELVGKTEAYEVEVVRVLERRVPELDDDFVGKIGDFESVGDFRTKIRERLARNFESISREKLRRDLIDEFVKEYPFEVPSSMVERVIQSELERIRRSNPGAEFDEEAYRARIRPDAVRSVQTFIILDRIKKEKGIEVTKEEVDERLESLAALNDMDKKEYRRRLIKEGRFEDFKNNIAEDKAYEWMIGVAEVTESTVGDDSGESRIVTP